MPLGPSFFAETLFTYIITVLVFVNCFRLVHYMFSLYGKVEWCVLCFSAYCIELKIVFMAEQSAAERRLVNAFDGLAVY